MLQWIMVRGPARDLFRSQFCYIDAYTDPAEPRPNWPPVNWPETREEYLERLRNTPIHLCRLQHVSQAYFSIQRD